MLKKHGCKTVEYQQISFVVTDAIFDDDAREKVPHWIEKPLSRAINCYDYDRQGRGRYSYRCCLDKEGKIREGQTNVGTLSENYPFPYYIIVQDVEAIPEVLSDALRQWFQMLNQD